MKKHLFIFLFFLFSFITASGQTDSISLSPQQFGNSVITNFWENPAYAGVEERHNINLNYRARWPGNYGPIRHMVSYDGRFGKKKRLGLGAYFSKLYEGLTKENIANLSTSFNFIIKEKHNIHLGLSVAYMQKKIDWDRLTFGQIDPTCNFFYPTKHPRVYDTRGNIDLGSGIWYDIEDFYFGLSILHLLKPTEGFIQSCLTKLPRDLFITSGYNFIVNGKF